MPPDLTTADQIARRVLRQRLDLRPKESVTIESYPSSLPWAAAFVREARRLGARPLVHYEDESAYWTAIDEGRASLVGTPSDAEIAALEESDVYIYFWGPENLRRLRSLPDSVAEKATAFNPAWYATARKHGVRGARMGIARVTPSNAKWYGVPYRAWRHEILTASARDIEPVVRDARRLERVLERGRSVRFTHPNGTDVTLGLVGRPMHEQLGRVTPATRKTQFGMMTSVPEAFVYVTVDERTAEGKVVANLPTRAFGPAKEGGRWRFEDGRLTRAQYRSGNAAFRRDYQAGSAGRDQPAVLEVGLEPGLEISPGLEESGRGTVSVGVGGNEGWGGKNSSSFSDWLSVRGGDLWVDGRPIVRRGRLL